MNRKSKSIFRLILHLALYTVGVLLFLGGLSLLLWFGRPYAALYLSSAQKEALERKVKLNQVKDNRIIVPSILVDSPIIEGLTAENLKKGIVMVSGSAYPGSEGNTIFEGHNYAQFVGGRQNFFTLLHLIKKGAKIYIYYEGKRYQYQVKEKKILKVSDPKLYARTSQEQITLITCASDWSLSMISPTRRVVITAKPL